MWIPLGTCAFYTAQPHADNSPLKGNGRGSRENLKVSLHCGHLIGLVALMVALGI